MITLHELLRLRGFDPERVRSVRHVVRPHERGRLVESIRGDRTAFEAFAAIQTAQTEERQIRHGAGTTHLAMFVGWADRRTMFAGLYRIRGVDRSRREVFDPIANRPLTAEITYDLEREVSLEPYVGKVFVDWGGGDRSWVQKRDKRIVAIESPPDPEFPGLRRFKRQISEIPTIYVSWRRHLERARGIYLLVDTRNGQQYVGSACGGQGFLGRWERYALDGHGGNRRMQAAKVSPSDLMVSVLEHFGDTATDDDILAAEGKWKEMLGSRAYGLNAN